jgi:hypothetical protein
MATGRSLGAVPDLAAFPTHFATLPLTVAACAPTAASAVPAIATHSMEKYVKPDLDFSITFNPLHRVLYGALDFD